MEPKLQMSAEEAACYLSAAKTLHWKTTHTGGVPIWTQEEEEEAFEREARLDALMESLEEPKPVQSWEELLEEFRSDMRGEWESEDEWQELLEEFDGGAQ